MNVLIASPQLYSAILAKKMQESKDWNPVYFQTNSSNHDFVKKEFPTAICHNYISAVKGVNPAGINIKKEIVLFSQLPLSQNCRSVRTAFESERHRVRTAFESELPLIQSVPWLSHIIGNTITKYADANNTT